MNSLQKGYVLRTTWIFLLTIVLALWIRSGGNFYAFPIFYHLFVRYDLPAAGLLIAILLASVLMAHNIREHWVDYCLDCIGNNSFIISISTFIILSIAAYFVYYHYPLCIDEYMPYFQSRIFSEGKLWWPIPAEVGAMAFKAWVFFCIFK